MLDRPLGRTLRRLVRSATSFRPSSRTRPTASGPRRAAVAVAVAVLTASAAPAASGQDGPPAEPPADWGPVSINLENVEYPAPVHFLDLHLYGKDVRLAYMDVAPQGEPNGRTVVLMHGMNFFGEYFYNQIEALTAAGFRVVVPDRIGFGRSSKPILPYSISLMADNARALLDHLSIEEAAVVGHSMGGMVATRFAFLFPERASHLVLLNSIGLSEPTAGRGWRDTEEGYRRNLDRTYESIARGQMRYYTDDTEWSPAYEKYIRIHYGWLQSGDWPRMAMVRTLLGEANRKEPIVHDWPHISTPALVMGGAEDGPNYPELVRNAARQLQNGRAHLIPGIGHNAHLVVPDRVHEALIPFLQADHEGD